MDSKEFWANEEKTLNKIFEAYEKRFPIVWMERDSFWKIYEKENRPNKKWLLKSYEFSLPLDGLRVRIKQPPFFRPPEEDFPGPVERWYGSIDNNLFLLTHYYGVDHNVLVHEDKEEISKKIVGIFKEFIAEYPYDEKET